MIRAVVCIFKQILTRRNVFNGKRYSEDPAIFAWDVFNEPRNPQNQEVPGGWRCKHCSATQCCTGSCRATAYSGVRTLHSMSESVTGHACRCLKMMQAGVRIAGLEWLESQPRLLSAR